MHGGVKFYRGSPGAARSYVEADRSRVDDYYLAEGTGLATRYVAGPAEHGERQGQRCGSAVRAGGTLDGPAYDRWVAGYEVEAGAPKGRLRQDAHGLRFVEVVVNGPKTWSPQAGGGSCTQWAWCTASRRSTGSGTPLSCATPTSAGRSPPTSTRSPPHQRGDPAGAIRGVL